MKGLAYSFLAALISSGAFVASATSTTTREPEPPVERQETEEPQDEDFIPTEKVPADSAISFPVDI